MSAHQILVTDVTRYSSSYCVAGWDLQRACMIRPIPHTVVREYEPSKFWSGQLAGQGQVFSVGNTVSFDADAPAPDFGFPHATEDRVLVAGSVPQLLGTVNLPLLADAAAGSISPDVATAFGGALQVSANNKAWVADGSVSPSLGAIETDPQAIGLFETNWDGKRKLRARVFDGVRTYDLSAPASDLREAWQAVGLQGLRAELAAASRVHVRLGLARAWAQNPCYAQVNGLYFL